jgi:hypothetical protein
MLFISDGNARMGLGSYIWNGWTVLGGAAMGCPPGRSLSDVVDGELFIPSLLSPV